MLGAQSVHVGEVPMPMRALAHRQKWSDQMELRLRLRLRVARKDVLMVRGVQQVRMSGDWQQDA